MARRRRSTTLLSLACVLPALLLVTLPGFTQTPTRDHPFPRVESGRRWGPFLVEPHFVIDNIGYDDNIYLVPKELQEPETDFVLRLGPEVTGQTRFGHRVALTIYDKLSGEVFLRHSDLNHADNDLKTQLDIFLNRFLLTTKIRWWTYRQRPNSEIDERTRRDSRDFRQGLRLFVSEKVDLYGEVRRNRIRYTDPDYRYRVDPDGDGTWQTVTIGEALDRDQDEVSLEVGWRPRGTARLFLRYRSRREDFLYDGLGRDSRERRREIGLELRPKSYLSGRISFGRARLRDEDDLFDYREFDGSVSRVRVTWKPTGVTRFLGKVERDVRFSTFENNLYYEYRLRELRVESFLGSVWGLQAGWSLRKLDWPEESTISIPGERRHDEITEKFVGVLVRLPGGVDLGLRFGVRDRTSNIAWAEDHQNYIMTTGRYAF